jgi:hypothetical protein
MATTTDAIDAALFTELTKLVYSTSNTGGVVKHLDRYSGEITSAEAMHQLVLNSTPCLLLGLEREDGADEDGEAAKQVSGRREEITRSTFAVLVAVQDVRQQQTPALKGTAGAYVGAAGCYKLMGAVKGKLNNLFIDGTYKGRPVKYVSGEPYYIERGKLYVYKLAFHALFVEADADIPTGDETPFTEFKGNVNREGTTELSDNTPPPDPDNPNQNPRNQLDVTIDQ